MYMNNRGLANYFLKKHDCAIQDFTECLQIESNDPMVWFNRANVYLQIGTIDSVELAIEDYERAISINPYTAKYWHAKGLAKQTLVVCIEDRYKEAQSALILKLRKS